MDTHIAPSPALDHDVDALSARLPGEFANPASSHEPGYSQETPSAGDRLPSSAPHRSTRRGRLFAGAAVVAVLVVAGGVYLISPYNHVYPVSGLASKVRNTAQVGVKLPPILAPSASLAKVNVPAQVPAIRDAYAPKTREQEVAELLSLHPAAAPAATSVAPPSAIIGAENRSSGVRRSYPTPALTAPAAAGPDVPLGYVASEPGSSLSAATRLAPTSPIAAASSAAVMQNAAVGLTPDAVPAPSPVPEAAAPAATSFRPVEPVLPPDAIAVLQNLRAGPLSSAEQVQVLGLVTEMASMVKDLRKQSAQLRADFGKSTADTSAHLRDYERRLALAEAKNAVSAASDASSDQVSAQTTADVVPVVRPASVSVTRAIAVVPAPAGVTAVKLYRVQAASPGLALLAQIDRGGGEGAQTQVAVGDTIPNYGRVKSIGQKGTAWVVTTERGLIQ